MWHVAIFISHIASSHAYILLQMTLQLQGLFLFSLVWSIAGTITGDSRKKFDVFFRMLISGTDPEHPKPKTIKLTKVCLSVCLSVQYVNVCLCVHVCVVCVLCAWCVILAYVYDIEIPVYFLYLLEQRVSWKRYSIWLLLPEGWQYMEPMGGSYWEGKHYTY